jgi:hypothetical protein
MECSRIGRGWHRNIARWILPAILIVLAPATAWSGFITTQSAAVNAIYAQVSFGTMPIQIRFNPGQTIVAPDLLNIDTDAKFTTLVGLGAASPIVDAFYVDSITFCGGPGVNIVGCGPQPGHTLAVDSAFAASIAVLDGSTNGAIDISHELGHNLGLAHIGDSMSTGNLMNPVLNSNVLTAAQVTTIRGSGLVQTDPVTGGFFITIQPIAIVATAAPEPSSLALIGAGLVIFAVMRRRQLRAT